MQHAIPRKQAVPATEELGAILPLYLASLVITLAGLGAVGVTYSSSQTPPLWIVLAVLGHGVSLALRRMRVAAEAVFYPVMLLGTLLVVQLVLSGSPLIGLVETPGGMPLDMLTGTVIASLAVVRTFTLLSNATLLFSPVPAITMLALVASTNPNAEVPLFFGLLILGSLFITGYEAHLRRITKTGRGASPVIFHLLAAWCITLAVSGIAILFPVVIQPVIAPLSPFALPAINRFRALQSFSRASSTQAPVGQGPIRLSPTPLFEVRTPEGGLFRTGSLTNYNGRGWTLERPANTIDVRSDERVAAAGGSFQRNYFVYPFPADTDRTARVPVRRVRQQITSLAYGAEGVPALGRIVELRHPRSRLSIHISGAVTGGGTLSPGQTMEVVSEIPEFAPEALRGAPAVDPETFDDPETLSLPQSTLPAKEMARRITSRATTPYDRVRAILDHIEKNYRYSLEEEATPPGEDAAVHYLTRSKRGACSLSATAAAVMCRAVGVPARVAVGYVGDEPLPDGTGFLLRQHHLHMWLETFFPGYGWVPFNPSPPMASVRENPLLLAVDRIRAGLSRIGGGGLDALLLVVVVLMTLGMGGYTGFTHLRALLRRRRAERLQAEASPQGAVVHAYAQTVALLGRRGWKREPWMTPREYLAWLRQAWAADPACAEMDCAPVMAAVERLTEAYEAARYAGTATPEAVAAAKGAAAEVERLSPRRRVPRKAAAPRAAAAEGTA